MKKVSIILVNYNGEKYNTECINSILSNEYKNIEIIVVDNCSTDNSLELLKRIFKDKITIIESKYNGGFSYANNLGIEYSINNNTDYIMLLNNDTVIKPNAIKIMVDTVEQIDDCVVVPKIKYYDDRNMIWYAGGKIDWKMGNAIHYGLNDTDNSKYNVKKKINFATGCCMILSKSTFDKIGYLDENYFLYFEDVDYSMKINNSKCNIIYEPLAEIYHKVSATTGGKDSSMFIYYITRNRLAFNKKYNDNRIYKMYIILLLIYKFIKWKLMKQKKLNKALILAIDDYKTGITGYRKMSF